MDQPGDLEILCPECGGKGTWRSYGEVETCARCWGAGHVPTSEGAKVLDLIRHNWQILADEGAK